MNSIKKPVALLCIVAAIAAESIAHADGVCAAGFHNLTAADRAVMLETLEVAKSTLPPAPKGWVIVGDDKVDAPTSICGDVIHNPWHYEHTRYYQQVGNQEARDKIIADAAAANAAAMKLKQPRLDAVTARIQELSKKQIAFIEKNDIEHATALNEDMAKLQEEYQKILDEGGGQQQLEAAAARASKDLQMNISITVNDGGQMFGPEVSNLALPPGADAAVRWESTSRGIDSSSVVILFGEWRSAAPGDWRIVPNPAVFTNKAHAIAIHITADPGRVASTLAAIDYAKLVALLPR